VSTVALALMVFAVVLVIAWCAFAFWLALPAKKEPQYRPSVIRSDVPGWSDRRQMDRDVRAVQRRAQVVKKGPQR
jgi:hypothetical protein